MTRLFFVNPFSARVARKGSTLALIAQRTGTPLVNLDTFEGLPAAVLKAAKDQVQHVVIEGGDGTVQGVMSEFLRQGDKFSSLPKFSIVPGGMTNQVAKNIGFSSAGLAYVEKRLVLPPKSKQVPLLHISDPGGTEYWGFLFSTGAIPQITKYTTGQLHKKGVGGSLAVLGGILKGIKGDDAALMKPSQISIDGIFEGLHLGTVVTTLPNNLILGLDPFWSTDEGAIRLTWADAHYRHLGRHIASLWVGRKHIDRSADGLHSTRQDEIYYSYSGPAVLDGEFLSFPSGKFTVRATPPMTFLR